MNNFDKFSDDFEKLILSKEFNDLSNLELKSLEAEGITEEEFNKIKNTLASLESLEEDSIEPSKDIKAQLMAAFDEPTKKEPRIINWPFWISSGLSIAALFAIAFFVIKPSFFNSDSQQPVAQKIELESKVEDTSSEEMVQPNLIEDEMSNEVNAEEAPNSLNESSNSIIEEITLMDVQESTEPIQIETDDYVPAPSQKRAFEERVDSEIYSDAAKPASVKEKEEVNSTKSLDAREIENVSTMNLSNTQTQYFTSPATSIQESSATAPIANYTAGNTLNKMEFKTPKTSVSLNQHEDVFFELVTIY